MGNLNGDRIVIIKTLVEFAQAVEAGKSLEINSAMICEHVGRRGLDGYALSKIIEMIDEGRIRIKSEPKKIDLSFLAGSGVDCEFATECDPEFGKPIIGKLVGVAGESYRNEVGGGVFGSYSRCRPRMDHWMSTAGIDPAAVKSLLDNGFTIETSSQIGLGDFHFKITGIKEGYTL